jgi:isoquinoline 1-oxidoreductase beta subunit
MEHSRRNFLKSTALLSSVFVIGLYIPSKSRADTKIEKALEPNAFVRISKDNKIDFIVGQVEMGQGIYTTFAMCIAEELNVNWEAINIMASDVKPVYNSAYGPLMITGGSSSVRTKQTEMRKIGSALNSMLCQAAAKRWKVKIQDVFTKDSKVINSINHKSFTFGELVSDLSQMEIPTDAKIKDLKECTIVGKPMKRHFKEAWAKVSGKAEFSIDVRIDNLKYAAVLHPTIFGSTIKSYDDSNALKKEGILKVKQIPTGIAVIAEHWWQAKEALNDLVVEWDEGTFAKISSDDLHKEYALMMEKEGISMRKDGDSKKAFEDAYKIISAEFDFPFLAHAPIEPESCVVHHTNKSATIWCNAQSKTIAQREIAKALGIEPINVAYNTPYLGSSFGRRAANNFDFMLDGLLGRCLVGKMTSRWGITARCTKTELEWL